MRFTIQIPFVLNSIHSVKIAFCFWILLLLGVFSLAYAQMVWDWRLKSNHPNLSCFSLGTAITSDVFGNSITTGRFKDTISFGLISLTAQNSSGGALYIVKHNSLGSPLWAKTISHLNVNTISNGFSVVTDAVGNIYVAGLYRGTVSFDLISSLPIPSNAYNAFIAKYDFNGNFLWVRTADTKTSPSFGNPCLSIDNFGDVYMTSRFVSPANGSTLTFGGQTTSTNMGENTFISKIDSSGNILWLRHTNNNNGNVNNKIIFNGLNVAPSGNIFLLGFLQGLTGSFALFPPNLQLGFPNVAGDILLAKYDSSGNAIWVQNIGGNLADLGTSITSDSLDNLFITGYMQSSPISFGGTTFFVNNTGVDGFFAKYDSLGNALWANQLYGNSFNWGNSVSNKDSNYLYLTGYFGSDTMYYQNNIFLPSTVSQLAGYILKLDTSGNLICKMLIDSVFPEISSFKLSVVSGSMDSSVYYTGSTLDNKSLIGKCSCGPDTLLASIGGTQTICNGASGQALIQFSGAGPYSFTYSDGMNNTTVTGVTNRYYFINATPSASVSYTLSAFSGANGPGPYSGMASIQVFTPPTATLSSAQTICQGDSVRLSVNLTGQGPWRFTYTSGVGNVTTTALTSPWTRNLLPSATFTWTINNFNNFVCSGTSPPISTVTVGTRPTFTLNASTPSCHNDSISFSTTMSGTPPWQLNYTDGTTPRTLTGLTASPFLFSDTPTASRTFTLTNATGCSRDTILTRTLLPPLTITHTTTGVSCFGGSNGTAQGIPNGGSGGYIYSWNTLPAQSTATATGLSAGSWILTVTDGLGCVRRDTAFITAPPALSVTLSATPIACFGQSNATATANANGGTSPYTYAWQTLPVQTTSVASSLSAGTWNITVTDANGCNLNNSIVITQPASALSAQTTISNVSCYGGNNGSAQAQGVGGTAPYTYNWQTNPIQTT
ncbi:MAG: hypothetical protein EBS07_12065, partial [Sphingobacteriia bacterium]|nr:hypothetical protein [Sphingobacteriia bacterium]